MTGDQYLQMVIAKYAVQHGELSPAEMFGSAVAGPLARWAGQYLNQLTYSGSYAKGTGVHGLSDVDIFISLKSNTPGNLRELYNNLFQAAAKYSWQPRKQNVSIGVTINGTRGDLVPGKQQEGYADYHSLFVSKRDSWTQTNVALHIDRVKNSGRTQEIRALKIWAFQNGLEIPSLHLELFTIDALQGFGPSVATNVLASLEAMGKHFHQTRVVDPANTANIISDDLTQREKVEIAVAAGRSARASTWEEIIR